MLTLRKAVGWGLGKASGDQVSKDKRVTSYSIKERREENAQNRHGHSALQNPGPDICGGELSHGAKKPFRPLSPSCLYSRDDNKCL